MRKLLLTAALAVLCGSTVTAGASAASPEPTGPITVFSTESEPLTTWDSPSGCQQLPPAAHVLINQSSKKVSIYGDPQCLSPRLTVAPGYGSHVPPEAGSFSVET